MNEKERLKKALHHEKTDRPPGICPGGMMNMITTDLMDKSGITWPEAHLNAEMMADLAQANYENGCFGNGETERLLITLLEHEIERLRLSA